MKRLLPAALLVAFFLAIAAIGMASQSARSRAVAAANMKSEYLRNNPHDR